MQCLLSVLHNKQPKGKRQGCESEEVFLGGWQIQRLYCCRVEAVIQREGLMASAWGLQLKQSTSIWALDHEGKKGSHRSKRQTKKNEKREGEYGQRKRAEVHLGKLLVIFRPDLYVSSAPACLPSTTCFLFVPADLISPRYHRRHRCHTLPPLLLSLFIWSQPLHLSFLWIYFCTSSPFSAIIFLFLSFCFTQYS